MSNCWHLQVAGAYLLAHGPPQLTVITTLCWASCGTGTPDEGCISPHIRSRYRYYLIPIQGIEMIHSKRYSKSIRTSGIWEKSNNNNNNNNIIMGRMGICFTSVATSWWGETCCLLLCFPTGTSYCIALSAVLNFDYLGECSHNKRLLLCYMFYVWPWFHG